MNICSPILSLDKQTRKAVLGILEVFVVLTLLLIMAVSYNTFFNDTPPFEIKEPAVVTASEIHNHKSNTDIVVGHEVHISRDMVFRDTASVSLSTILVNKETGFSVDLPDTKITSSLIGPVTTQKLYYVGHLSTGEWCMYSIGHWTPFLSFRERSIETALTCFSVK